MYGVEFVGAMKVYSWPKSVGQFNIIAHRGVLADGVEFLHKPFTTKDSARKVRLNFVNKDVAYNSRPMHGDCAPNCI